MKPLLLVFNLACGADAATTHVALAQGGVYREAVLPTQNPWVVDTVAAGQAVGGSAALVWLDRHGHGKTARIIGWTVVGLRTGAVVWNVRELRRARRR